MSWDRVIMEVPDDALKEAIVGEFSSDDLAGVWERPLTGDRSELVLYFGAGAHPPLVKARIQRIFERNGHTMPPIRLGRQQPRDWTREWRKGFSSFPVGQRFRVVPSWEPLRSDEDRLIIKIDPGQAFGTGTHETTRLMLEGLEGCRVSSGAVLDLGAGSGILSIAARNLGFENVIACDVDSDAVAVAVANGRRNQEPFGVFVGSTETLPTAYFELLLANLNLSVIVEILPEIRRILEPGGLAILSGVLVSQELLLREALSLEEFRLVETSTSGEWMAVAVVSDGD